MTLINTIKADQLQARKLRESLKATLLTTLISEAEVIGKNDGNREVTDAEVVAVVKKFVKGIDETLSFLVKASITDERYKTVAAERYILDKYLPVQLTIEELKVLIIGADLADTSKGSIMKYLKENFAGQYDGKVAAKVIDELLK
jgi:uncharacterized protein YqeY